ncbi:hypothetical protein PCANC_01283 [Puccinia coronata f. sp. avenae]|uniref:Uncharacterized protein n=1 Tax=Puccinia coronata f. sp. avenae TaxID=200324 RepID=A0A2N5W3V3_9BASI|nr:hypothetical protein PCANC_01283 [Puccinia coronata f. sp. avenae]
MCCHQKWTKALETPRLKNCGSPHVTHSKAIYKNCLAVGVTAWILGAIKAVDGGVVHLKAIPKV